MLNRLSLRQQILFVLVPLLVGGVTAYLILMAQSYRVWKQAWGLKSSADYFMAVSSTIHQIQNERGITLLYTHHVAPKEDLEEQRKAVDEKVHTVTAVFPELGSKTIEDTESVFKDLSETRKFVDSGGNEAECVQRYARLVDRLIMFEVSRSREFPLNGIENKLISQSVFEGSKENIAKLRAMVTDILAQKKPINLETQAEVMALKSGIATNLSSYGLIISAETREHVDGFMTSQTWQFVLDTVRDVIENAQTGKYRGESTQFYGLISTGHEAIYAFISEETSKIETEVLNAYHSAHQVFWIYLFTTFFGISSIMVIMFFCLRSISKRLGRISNDLTEGANATGTLARDMSASSYSLTEGVTAQSSALQETVSSLEQVRAMVSKNSDNAQQATMIAAQSAQDAEKGKNAVADVMAAMNEISQSNDAIEHQVEVSNDELGEIVRVISEIADKTKVINEIVFQTKLLSFNASVEAARAGEHGKGFSVVAEEVGNLAQMSGLASHEISQLLDGGLKKVESIVRDSKSKVSKLVIVSKQKVQLGTETARRCDHVLDELLNGVEEMNTRVVEIATASKEQSQGVTEISNAMNQLESITHTNTSASNQVSTVANELNNQVQKMENHVSNLLQLSQGSSMPPIVGKEEVAKAIEIEPTSLAG